MTNYDIAAVKSNSILAGIKPFSPTTVAAYGVLTKLLNNDPVITAVYSGSTTATFSLKSFYFGCTGVTTLVPTKCTIALAGYNKAGRLIASTKVGYVPSSGLTLSANMQYVPLPSTFTGLSYVKLATSYSGLSILGTTSIDNVAYTITTTG